MPVIANTSCVTLSQTYWNSIIPQCHILLLLSQNLFIHSLCFLFFSSVDLITVLFLLGSSSNILLLIMFLNSDLSTISSLLSACCSKSSRISFNWFVLFLFRLMIFKICFLSLPSFTCLNVSHSFNHLFLMVFINCFFVFFFVFIKL